MEYQEWRQLSYSSKNQELYISQMETLKKFVERNAISRAEYEKGLHSLMEKMQEA